MTVLGGTGLVMMELSGNAADGQPSLKAARVEPSAALANAPAPTTPPQAQSGQDQRGVRVVYTGAVTAQAAPPAKPAPKAGEPQRSAPEPTPPTPVTLAALAAPASPSSQADRTPAPPAPIAAASSTATIDLNTASLEQLNALPGAGMVGRAIIKGRPYASAEDLLAKRILNRATYARIKDQVAVR
ncbi:MAG TPA: helix-hairpin-helix domain-containing protein [Beijerinckiaceae bacterium]